jgi:hypothetical protein
MGDFGRLCRHLRLWPVFLRLAGLVVQQRRRGVRLWVDSVAADVDLDGGLVGAPVVADGQVPLGELFTNADRRMAQDAGQAAGATLVLQFGFR